MTGAVEKLRTVGRFSRSLGPWVRLVAGGVEKLRTVGRFSHPAPRG